jgi:hypothetical protein
MTKPVALVKVGGRMAHDRGSMEAETPSRVNRV